MKAKLIYSAVALFACMLGMTLASIWYTDRQSTERARDICGLITRMDDVYQETPPTTAAGKSIAAELHAYRTKLGC